jgi:hypothetical protein
MRRACDLRDSGRCGTLDIGHGFLIPRKKWISSREDTNGYVLQHGVFRIRKRSPSPTGTGRAAISYELDAQLMLYVRASILVHLDLGHAARAQKRANDGRPL